MTLYRHFQSKDGLIAEYLRELAADYIQKAERLEAETRGRVAESEELISAALDAVARDYFSRALALATSRRKR